MDKRLILRFIESMDFKWGHLKIQVVKLNKSCSTWEKWSPPPEIVNESYGIEE